MKKLILSAAILAAAGACNTVDAHEHGDAEALPNKIVPAGTAPEVANPFHPVRLMLSSEETAGEVTLYEFEVPAQSAGSPPHTHTLEDEYFFILSGTLDVLVDGQVSQLSEGDFAALTRGHTHMFWNGSDAPVRLLMATTGASFEAFMGSVAPRLADAQPEGPQEAGAVIGALAAEHGITITMEDMPAEAAPYYQ
ncbi:MAG: cupin domain-containing protein [Henriciella sp.]